MAFTTRKSLLMKVRAGDEVSWNEFYDAYAPLIRLCAGDCGLTADEADELVQQVMCEIFHKDILGKYNIDQVPDNVVFHYDPARGRFRHYLKKIIRNQALNLCRKRRDNVSLEAVPSPVDPADAFDVGWEEEWRKHLLTMALAELRLRVQAETYVAFEMYALQERPAAEVADFLNLSVASVYTAKSRCIAALKEIIANWEER